MTPMTQINQAPLLLPQAQPVQPAAQPVAQPAPAAPAAQAAAPQVAGDVTAAKLTPAVPPAPPADINNVNLDATELRALDNLMQTYMADGELSAAEQKVYQEIRGLFAKDGGAAAPAGAPKAADAPAAAPKAPDAPAAAPQAADPKAGAGPVTPKKPALNPNPTWRELIETLDRELGAPGQGAVGRGSRPGMWSKKLTTLDNAATDPRGRSGPKAFGLSRPAGSSVTSGSSVGDSPASSSQFWGPNTTKFLREAYSKLQSGDISGAKESYSKGASTASPVMLDLNGDGKLGTTGVSTAKERVDGEVGKTVSFDIDGDGAKDQVEWMDGKGDGMLVDDRDGGATAAAAGNGEIDGTRLFGDQGGKFDNGYTKMAQHDVNQDGKLTGAELEGLKTWVDDGDAKVEAGELKTLAEQGITELSTGMKLEQNARGEDLMRSTFVQNGETKVTEDVWFAQR
jgi:hypothetical protein